MMALLVGLLPNRHNNNLISLKHTERSCQHIRIIDELPDFLYTALLDGTFGFLTLRANLKNCAIILKTC